MPYINAEFLAGKSFPIPLEDPHQKWVLAVNIDLPMDHRGPVFLLGDDVQVLLGGHVITKGGRPYGTPLDSALDPATSTIRAKAYTDAGRSRGMAWDGSTAMPIRDDHATTERGPGEW